MIFKPNINFIFALVAILLSFQGCLKDNVSSVVSVNLETSALVLRYFESRGDYINSSQMPSAVKPEEVFNNLNNYLIIDVRTKTDYAGGHIPGSFNVSNDSLLQFIKWRNVPNYTKVVIVSAEGQSASYYTCLLRLYGYDNVYALLFGMAEWNSAFSAIWQNNLGYYPPQDIHFTSKSNSLNKMSPLPPVKLGSSSQNLDDKIKSRIAEIIKKGFTLDTNYQYFTNGLYNKSVYYLVCFGNDTLYYNGHFDNTVYYNPAYDIRSTLNLQTFPTDKKILIYSYSGHLSAFLTAYLRVLGYDAKTLMYGASSFMYNSLMQDQKVFAPFVFLENDIHNYSYKTGSLP